MLLFRGFFTLAHAADVVGVPQQRGTCGARAHVGPGWLDTSGGRRTRRLPERTWRLPEPHPSLASARGQSRRRASEYFSRKRRAACSLQLAACSLQLAARRNTRVKPGVPKHGRASNNMHCASTYVYLCVSCHSQSADCKQQNGEQNAVATQASTQDAGTWSQFALMSPGATR